MPIRLADRYDMAADAAMRDAASYQSHGPLASDALVAINYGTTGTCRRHKVTSHWLRLIADEDTNSARYIVLYDDTEERRYGSILMVF